MVLFLLVLQPLLEGNAYFQKDQEDKVMAVPSVATNASNLLCRGNSIGLHEICDPLVAKDVVMATSNVNVQEDIKLIQSTSLDIKDSVQSNHQMSLATNAVAATKSARVCENNSITSMRGREETGELRQKVEQQQKALQSLSMRLAAAEKRCDVIQQDVRQEMDKKLSATNRQMEQTLRKVMDDFTRKQKVDAAIIESYRMMVSDLDSNVHQQEAVYSEPAKYHEVKETAEKGIQCSGDQSMRSILEDGAELPVQDAPLTSILKDGAELPAQDDPLTKCSESGHEDVGKETLEKYVFLYCMFFYRHNVYRHIEAQISKKLSIS